VGEFNGGIVEKLRMNVDIVVTRST